MANGTTTGKAADNERVAQQRATATAWLFFVGLHCSRKACEEVIAQYPLDFTARGELKQGADERLLDIVETCQQVIARYAPEGTLTKVLAAFTVISTTPSLKDTLKARQQERERHIPVVVLEGALDMLESKAPATLEAGESVNENLKTGCVVGATFTRHESKAITVKTGESIAVEYGNVTCATYRITSINSYDRVTARRLGDNATLTFHRDNFKAVAK